MIGKEELVKNLKNVKIVIGNGFDLHCKLPTRYRDYFLHDKSKNDYFKSWISSFSPQAKNFIKDKNIDSWRNFEHFDKATIWDFYFYLVSNIESDSQCDWKWCDIEKVMLEWLYENEEQNSNKSGKCWKYVFDIIRGIDNTYDDCLWILASVAYKKNNERAFETISNFYQFLLKQLKLFERNFGEYISNLIYNSYKKRIGVYSPNTKYANFVDKTINDLCNVDNLVSIESFNYGAIDWGEYKSIFHNINGNFDNPIFGIDSSAFFAPDPRYIFTKTSRRMELDMLEYHVYEQVGFENIIIYGHSLNSSDYSYFFSLFDKIKITDFSNQSIIVFAYSIYDEKKAESIEQNYRLAIFNLFQEYSKYKGNKENPNRLLDALTTQGKILMYEIPEYNY